MLQNSNTGHDFASFSRLQSQLDEAMAIIVNSNFGNDVHVFICLEYYNSFNNAVSVFSGIVDNSKCTHHHTRN